MPKYACPCKGPCKQAPAVGAWCGACSGRKRGERGLSFGAGDDYSNQSKKKCASSLQVHSRVYLIYCITNGFDDGKIFPFFLTRNTVDAMICAPQPLELRAAAWGHGTPKYEKCKETQSQKALESLGETLNSEHREMRSPNTYKPSCL